MMNFEAAMRLLQTQAGETSEELDRISQGILDLAKMEGSTMSIEDELAELSTVYHGQRERLEALEQLVRDYALWVAPMETTVESGETIPQEWWTRKRTLQLRAKALLSETLSQEQE